MWSQSHSEAGGTLRWVGLLLKLRTQFWDGIAKISWCLLISVRVIENIESKSRSKGCRHGRILLTVAGKRDIASCCMVSQRGISKYCLLSRYWRCEQHRKHHTLHYILQNLGQKKEIKIDTKWNTGQFNKK